MAVRPVADGRARRRSGRRAAGGPPAGGRAATVGPRHRPGGRPSRRRARRSASTATAMPARRSKHLGRLPGAEALGRVQTARALRELPAVDAAYARGDDPHRPRPGDRPGRLQPAGERLRGGGRPDLRRPGQRAGLRRVLLVAAGVGVAGRRRRRGRGSRTDPRATFVLVDRERDRRIVHLDRPPRRAAGRGHGRAARPSTNGPSSRPTGPKPGPSTATDARLEHLRPHAGAAAGRCAVRDLPPGRRRRGRRPVARAAGEHRHRPGHPRGRDPTGRRRDGRHRPRRARADGGATPSAAPRCTRPTPWPLR